MLRHGKVTIATKICVTATLADATATKKLQCGQYTAGGTLVPGSVIKPTSLSQCPGFPNREPVRSVSHCIP